MDRRRRFGVLFWVVAIMVVAVVGVLSYNAGVTQGLAEAGRVGPGTGYVGPYIGGPGFGFGFFGILSFLLFFLLLFGLVRAFAWRGPGWYGRHERWHDGPDAPGPWRRGGGGSGGGEGAPPMFEEWHRRAHGEGGTRDATAPPPARDPHAPTA